jgi:hypothetical protein
MTVTTTAPRISWDSSPREVHPPQVAEVGEPRVKLVQHARAILAGEAVRPDPDARVRMASMLHDATGWDIFPELPTDREYVSKLWAEDWDSPEDAIYDTE